MAIKDLMFWKKKEGGMDKGIGDDSLLKPSGEMPPEIHDRIGYGEQDPLSPGSDFGPQPAFGGAQQYPPQHDPYSSPDAPSSFQEQHAYGQQNQPYQQSSSSASSRDFEILNSKLDTIKALLENLNHRVTAIEQIAKGEQQQQQRRQW